MYWCRANATHYPDPSMQIFCSEVADCTQVHAAMLHLPIWWLQEAKNYLRAFARIIARRSEK